MKLQASRFLIVLVSVCLVGCIHSESSKNETVEQTARRLGVEYEQVLEVTEDLGVDPTTIDQFGSCSFPCNYYEHQFKSFELEQGRPPTRSEVEQLVKGYSARCDPGYSDTIQYIYYSSDINPGWSGMVMEVVFQLPPPGESAQEDPLYSHIQTVDLRDHSVNPPSQTYWHDCIQEYLDNAGKSQDSSP